MKFTSVNDPRILLHLPVSSDIARDRERTQSEEDDILATQRIRVGHSDGYLSVPDRPITYMGEEFAVEEIFEERFVSESWPDGAHERYVLHRPDGSPHGQYVETSVRYARKNSVIRKPRCVRFILWDITPPGMSTSLHTVYGGETGNWFENQCFDPAGWVTQVGWGVNNSPSTRERGRRASLDNTRESKKDLLIRSAAIWKRYLGLVQDLQARFPDAEFKFDSPDLDFACVGPYLSALRGDSLNILRTNELSNLGLPQGTAFHPDINRIIKGTALGDCLNIVICRASKLHHDRDPGNFGSAHWRYWKLFERPDDSPYFFEKVGFDPNLFFEEAKVGDRWIDDCREMSERDEKPATCLFFVDSSDEGLLDDPDTYDEVPRESHYDIFGLTGEGEAQAVSDLGSGVCITFDGWRSYPHVVFSYDVEHGKTHVTDAINYRFVRTSYIGNTNSDQNPTAFGVSTYLASVELIDTVSPFAPFDDRDISDGFASILGEATALARSEFPNLKFYYVQKINSQELDLEYWKNLVRGWIDGGCF